MIDLSINPRPSLDELFLKHGTDKSSLGHNYVQYYEMFFERFRDQPINLLEIGVYGAASVRAWKDYFSKANIYGVDLEYMPQHNSERLFMIQADQSKDEDLQRLCQVQYDLIVEDASHRSIDQIKTFEYLFPRCLNPGGIYVIEDLLCAYDERWNKEANVIEWLKPLVGDVQMNGAVPGSRLNANKHDAIKLYPGNWKESMIHWVFIAMGIVFIKKMP